MLKIINLTAILGFCSCVTTSAYGTGWLWDFDHNISFKQVEISKKQYNIVITPKVKTQFSQMSTFLVRHSFELCKSYGFKIEYLEEIEKYDDSISQPNLLMKSLRANIQCK